MQPTLARLQVYLKQLPSVLCVEKKEVATIASGQMTDDDGQQQCQ